MGQSQQVTVTKRYLVMCLAHKDRRPGKRFFEVDHGDVFAGWADHPPSAKRYFDLRFSRLFDRENVIGLGRINWTERYQGADAPSYVDLPQLRVRLRPEDLELIRHGDIIAVQDKAVLLIREIFTWQ